MLTVAFQSFPDFSNNSRALFQYMYKKYKNKMKFIWVIKDNDIKKKIPEKNVEVVVVDQDNLREKLSNVDVFFSTHANLIDYKEENSDTLYVELWHGVSPKKVGYLINNMNESDYKWLNKMQSKIDYFIVPSEFWVPIFSARFNILPERILPLGFPMLDNIVNASGKENLSKVLDCDLSKHEKIIYYMPTARLGFGRNEEVSPNLENTLNLKPYNEKDLITYLEKNNYLLCVKYHPSEELNLKVEEGKNIRFIKNDMLKKNGFDVNMILNAADLMISDYSSLGLLFLILNKPVLYLASDEKDYAKSRGILFNDFSFWTDGDEVTTLEELLTKIDYKFNNSDERIKARKKLFFGNLNDGGCSNIVDYFFDKNGNLNKDIKYTFDENYALKQKNNSLQEELNNIYNSKGYKLLEKLRKVRYRR